MSDYDDIFRKLDDHTAAPVTPEAQIEAEAEMAKMSGNPKVRKWLLLGYVLFQLLASGFYYVYQSIRWSNSAAILDNITVLADPRITLGDSENPDFPYRVTLQGSFRNDSGIVLPCLYVTVTLFDAEGNQVDTLYKDAEYVAPGALFTFEETVDYAEEVYSSSAPEYGFTEASLFRVALTAVPTLLCFFAFLYLDRDGFRGDTKKLKRKPAMSVLQVVAGFFLVIYASYIGAYVLQFLGLSGNSANQQAIQSLFQDNLLNQIILFLLLVVLTPVVEEIVFRKVVFGFLESKIGPVWTILVSGAIFGLVHTVSAGDFVNSIPYVLMGFALGFVYWWSRKNIWVSAGAHALNNLVSFLASLFLLGMI